VYVGLIGKREGTFCHHHVVTGFGVCPVITVCYFLGA